MSSDDDSRPDWQGAARRLAHAMEKRWDGLRADLRRRIGFSGTPLIAPYRGFGDADSFWLRGRVLADHGVVSAAHTESLWRNIVLTAKRYETDEIPGARLSYSFGDQTGEVLTDEEGYFDFVFSPEGNFQPGTDWQDVHFILEEIYGQTPETPLGATVRVRTPSPSASIGIISDIDDTIVFTGATNFLKHWRTVAMNSAESRVPFAGTSPLYRALEKGANGGESNPVFYVSSSPWTLFDLFERFMTLHDIPFGPMLLRDFGLDDSKWLTGPHSFHKSRMIDRLMAAYPDISFILIGDSGQHDTEIYHHAAERHPGRVAAVFIRDVTPADRDAQVSVLLDELKARGIPVAYSPDLVAASELCLDKGWIDAAAARRVRSVAARETGS